MKPCFAPEFIEEPLGRSPTVGGTLICAVDDTEDLTDLYRELLAGAGYCVQTFNDRWTALDALSAQQIQPDLLITDYLGPAMPVDRFLHACRALNPALRILMASGLPKMHTQLSSLVPTGFIRKPFTPDELLRGVRAALCHSDWSLSSQHSP